jgi:hypothetical protein
MSSGSLVLVDQAAQDRFSADLADAEVPCDDAGRMARAVGDALADALVRPGGVVVLLVFGQNGSQVRFAEDQATAAGTDLDDHCTRRERSGHPITDGRANAKVSLSG